MKPLPEADLQEIATRCADVFRELRDARVLITGASGFVGGWMWESATYALGADAPVTYHARRDLALYHHGVRPVWPMEKPHLTGDIRKLTLPPYITHVIHCANAGSHAENVDDPHKVAGMIVDGTKRVVAECERVGVKRLLLLSSGSVYVPKHDGTPYRETDPVQDQPVTLFGYAKRCAERWALASKVPTVSARGFAMLGPRLGPQFAASEFMAAALAGKPIHVTSPNTMRSYLYASDMAAWLWTLLVRGEAGTAYNVGGDTSCAYRVGDLADRISFESELDAGTLQEANAPGAAFVADMSRGLALGLSLGVPVNDGVRRWMAWERGA